MQDEENDPDYEYQEEMDQDLEGDKEIDEEELDELLAESKMNDNQYKHKEDYDSNDDDTTIGNDIDGLQEEFEKSIQEENRIIEEIGSSPIKMKT